MFKRPSKGFSVVELIVAMVILAIVMVGFLMGILQYTHRALSHQYGNIAATIAEQEAQRLLAIPLSSPLFTNGRFPLPNLVDTDRDGIATHCDSNETTQGDVCDQLNGLNFPLGTRGSVQQKGIRFDIGLIIFPHNIQRQPQPVHVCIVVWYEDPMRDNRCEFISTLVTKGF